MKPPFLMLMTSFLLLGSAWAEQGQVTYEIVLGEERIEFGNLEDSVTRGLSLLVRNVGETELKCPDVMHGLELVWDGVTYKRQGGLPWGGRGTLKPKESWKATVGLNSYKLPPTLLLPGRHTIAFRDEIAQSNTITIFIMKEEANKPSEATR